MSVCRDNHYVPQLYLRNWGTDNKVFVHRLLVPHEKYPEWEHCAIKNTAYIDNLYVRIEDGAEYDDFEIDFNRQVETPAKPVLDKICAEQKLTPADWRILCDYITAQYVRTPSFYHFVAEWGKKEVPKTVDSVLAGVAEKVEWSPTVQAGPDRTRLLPLELSVSKSPDDQSNTYLKVTTVIGKNLWLYTINHTLSTDSPVRQAFRKMKWSVVTAPTGIVWPTCDTPVIIAETDQHGNLHVTNGYGIADRAIVFPISPHKVLLATHKRTFDWRFEADIFLAQQIKNAIVNNALMYVYSSIKDSEVMTIRNRFVDETEFRRQQEQYAEWYNKYKTDEAPLLTTKQNIIQQTQEEIP